MMNQNWGGVVILRYRKNKSYKYFFLCALKNIIPLPIARF